MLESLAKSQAALSSLVYFVIREENTRLRRENKPKVGGERMHMSRNKLEEIKWTPAEIVQKMKLFFTGGTALFDCDGGFVWSALSLHLHLCSPTSCPDSPKPKGFSRSLSTVMTSWLR